MKRAPPKRNWRRWTLLASATLAGMAYAYWTDPDRLKASVLRMLDASWRGGRSVGEVRYTPWGGLQVHDLILDAGADKGRLVLPRLRLRWSPLRPLLGESMLSDLELDGAVLELPAGPWRGGGLPLAPHAKGVGDRRGSLLVTISEARIQTGGVEAVRISRLALHCQHRSTAVSTDLTGWIQGPDWAEGSFRASLGPAGCRWGADLHEIDLTPRLRSLLWPRVRAVWDDLSPSGKAEFSARGGFLPGAKGSGTYVLEIATQDARMKYRKLPVPLSAVHGRVVFDETGRVELRDFWGYAAGALATCEGVFHCGERPTSDLEFTVLGLPMAPAVLAALPESLRESLDWVGVEGIVSGRLRILHDAELAEPHAFSLSAYTDNLTLRRLPLQPVVREGRMRLEGRLNGRLPQGGSTRIRGELEIPRAEVSGRAVEGMRGSVLSDGPRLEVALQEARYASGTVTGRLVRQHKDGHARHEATLDLADARMEEMKKGTLLADQPIRGVLSAHLDFGWTDSDASTLSGKGHADLKDGYLFALPPLSAPLALLSLNILDREPVIRDGRLDFSLDARTLQLERLILPSDQVTVRAEGTLKDDGKVDLRIVANLGRGKTLRNIPVVRETAEGLQGLLSWLSARGLNVYRVTGTIKEPKVEKVQLFIAKSDVDVYHKLLEPKP